MTDVRTLISDIRNIADAIEKVAWSIPAPNVYTPQLINIIQAAKGIANEAEADAHRQYRSAKELLRERGYKLIPPHPDDNVPPSIPSSVQKAW